ncbi:MAG: hypothetical protein K2V38_15825 [Gemmataceae bacterium]|nr:hypothetical protein [Gemmataceae bacterium]
MTDNDIYDMAQHEITSGDLGSWLDRQPNDVLTRLYAGLAHARDNTLVVRSDADRGAAAAHAGRVVVRDENGIEGSYGWDDWCSDAGLLDAVTETLGGRLHPAAVRGGSSLAEVLNSVPPGMVDAWREYLRLLAGKVDWWARRAAPGRGPGAEEPADAVLTAKGG